MWQLERYDIFYSSPPCIPEAAKEDLAALLLYCSPLLTLLLQQHWLRQVYTVVYSIFEQSSENTIILDKGSVTYGLWARSGLQRNRIQPMVVGVGSRQNWGHYLPCSMHSFSICPAQHSTATPALSILLRTVLSLCLPSLPNLGQLIAISDGNQGGDSKQRLQ